MISAFMNGTDLHALHVIKRDGVTSIVLISMCNVTGDPKTGLFQVPEWSFDGRAKYGDTPVCPKCSRAVTAMKNPPPK